MHARLVCVLCSGTQGLYVPEKTSWSQIPVCIHSFAGMAAYSELQAKEFASAKDGYRATTHQQFVGTGYFDLMSQVIAEGASSVTALNGSTEAEQFH